MRAIVGVGLLLLVGLAGCTAGAPSIDFEIQDLQDRIGVIRPPSQGDWSELQLVTTANRIHYAWNDNAQEDSAPLVADTRTPVVAASTPVNQFDFVSFCTDAPAQNGVPVEIWHEPTQTQLASLRFNAVDVCRPGE